MAEYDSGNKIILDHPETYGGLHIGHAGFYLSNITAVGPKV
jgi:hypothetical protein